AEVDVAADVVRLVHVGRLPDRVDHVASSARPLVEAGDHVGLGGGVPGCLADEFQVVPAERGRGGVVALAGDVDADVVGAVAGLVVQVDAERAAEVGRLPGAGGVHGAVAAALGVAAAAELAVGDGGLVVAADVVAVEAVPAPPRGGGGQPCLP